MDEANEFENKIKRLNKLLAGYIPPFDTWTPAETALFKPMDISRVPVSEAQEMQLKAIKYAFSRHYAQNHFYGKYCEMREITPDDIKTCADLEKIPLVPDLTFKQHPSGADFAHWIANVYTGDLPTVVIDSPDPTFDEVVNAFNKAGLAVAFSSGTSGRHTVIPRDLRTYLTCQYSVGKLGVSMSDELDAQHTLLLIPNPTKTNLWIAKIGAFQSDMYPDVIHGLDVEISADLASAAMSDKDKRDLQLQAQETGRLIVEKAIRWLMRYESTTDKIRFFSLPFILSQIMDALERLGKTFEFGERAAFITGGGWKISEDERVSPGDFCKRVEKVFGVPETRYFDLYAMTEMNGAALTCPEGHYLHLPYTWFKPMVIDRDLLPAGYGEWGRFAFLDGLAESYPGFIMSGDLVRMLEHCPVCDRLGPVLEPEVKRAPSEEVRGCAEEVRRVFAYDLER